MINILESAKYVVDNSVFVKINVKNLDKVTNKLNENNLNQNVRDLEEVFKCLNKEQVLAYNTIYNAINFCY